MKYTAQDIARILNATAEIASLHEPTFEEALIAFIPTIDILMEFGAAAQRDVTMYIGKYQFSFRACHVDMQVLNAYGDYMPALLIYFNEKPRDRNCSSYEFIDLNSKEYMWSGFSTKINWTELLNMKDQIIEAAIAALQSVNAKKVALINAVKH